MNPNLEQPRRDALGSSAFRDGRLRLVYSPLADPDGLPGEVGGSTEFTMLVSLFEESGVNLAHLDGGWAINAYDRVYMVVKTIEGLSVNKPVTRALLRGGIAALSATDEDTQLVGANGRIGFENNGNRAGTPVVVRLCLPNSNDPEGRTRTVVQTGSFLDQDC